MEAIIERSGVARQTMYRHFGSKQDLVLAFLARREQLWTRGWLQAEVSAGPRIPATACWRSSMCLTSGFDRPDFEGCSFINVMLEHPEADHPLHRASTAYLAGIRGFLQDLAGRPE